MADFECTCSVVKGERDIAWGEDCYCWYPKPKYNERIVRCRDCKHHVDSTVCDRFGEYPSASGTWLFANENGFCAWGERRDDA